MGDIPRRTAPDSTPVRPSWPVVWALPPPEQEREGIRMDQSGALVLALPLPSRETLSKLCNLSKLQASYLHYLILGSVSQYSLQSTC